MNPIVIFFFYIGLAFSIILSKSWFSLGIFFIPCIILLLYNLVHIKSIIKRVKPFIYFFPILIFIYLFISFVFTNSTWNQIINEAGFTISKFSLLVIIMALYVELSKQQNLVLSIRSIWAKFNLQWRWVEDLFVFLELTIRFFPTFQQEWKEVTNSKKALGLKISNNRWDRIKSVTTDLPGIILQSYRNAENISNVMLQRGYGNKIPRGVAFPIRFRFSDVIMIIVFLFGFTYLNLYVSL